MLAGHADVELVGLFGSESRDAEPFSAVHPRWRDQIDLPIQPTSVETVLECEPDAVFLATPHEVSHDLVPQLLAHGIVALDLSAAFRLTDSAAYPKYYGFPHEHENLLKTAVYGLPEHFGEELASADLIAAPGCYPTSIVLAVKPLVDAGAINNAQPIIADCASGVSGAGRSPAVKSLFCEVSYQPYGVLTHRHTPEICQYAGADVIFTPHLAPFDRGIVSTIHAALALGWNDQKVRDVLETTYGEEPFVRVLSEGNWPSVASVERTNFCDIGLAVDDARSRVILVSAIDNLLKGAAGQAVQCMNVRFGFPQTVGLPAGRKGVMTCLSSER